MPAGNGIHIFKRNYFKVVLSVLIGAASHQLWNWFTHYSVHFTNGNRRLSYLFFGWEIKTYTILHMLNSIIGLLILLVLVLKLPADRHARRVHHNKWYWVEVIFVSSAIIFIRAA
ncbi:DUF4184 family protein [Pontibacter chitinilyticus]|uniref:DUF4184 family protein n=1 Tax=Pontibacter chitinilyticus TaxID=2674989 RepID=UPI003D2A98DD